MAEKLGPVIWTSADAVDGSPDTVNVRRESQSTYETVISAGLGLAVTFAVRISASAT